MVKGQQNRRFEVRMEKVRINLNQFMCPIKRLLDEICAFLRPVFSKVYDVWSLLRPFCDGLFKLFDHQIESKIEPFLPNSIRGFSPTHLN